MSVRTIVLCIASLLALPVAAQSPEDAYGKLHGAVLQKNLKEVMRYATNARRAAVAANPAAEATLETMAAILPRTYSISSKSVAADGNSAQLHASGVLEQNGQREPMSGLIDLRRESGEWRVEQWAWASERAASGQTAQAPAPAEKAEASAESKPQPAKPAPSRAKAAAKPPAPSDAAMTRTLAKVGCIIKPVMSDQDLKNCGVRLPLAYERPR